MNQALSTALVMYGIAAAISMFVAALIKALFILVRRLNRAGSR